MEHPTNQKSLLKDQQKRIMETIDPNGRAVILG